MIAFLTNKKMNNIKESPETTREIKLSTFDFLDYKKKGTPQHKPTLDIVFLEWFIGFFEAEGCLQFWKDNGKNRFAIEINQKDPGLMYKIRTRLGFGEVQKINRTKSNQTVTYYRFTTSSRKNLERFIFLVNGNLITQKKREQFKHWISLRNLCYNENVVVKPNFQCPSLLNAWLSGFLEGDAGFWVSKLNLRNHGQNFFFTMKFYITQKEELLLLQQINKLFQITSPLRTLTNSQSDYLYNDCEAVASLKSLFFVLDYLEKYPFLGKRSIQLTRWKQLAGYCLTPRLSTPKLLTKVQRLINGTKPDSF